jgi:eukaryotic-like serine/threonine-protein kinase
MTPTLLASLEDLAKQYIANYHGKIEKLIGNGGSAAVFKASTPKATIALKVYDPKFLAGDNGPSEKKRIELQQKLIGQTCSSLVDTLKIETIFKTCFVAMEYLPWQSLKECLASVPDETVDGLVSQLVQTVVFFESVGLVHRDIKPENILVSPDFKQLKVIDLGVVRKVDSEEDDASSTDHGQRRPFIATAQYSSPEYLFRLEAPSPDSWRALTIYQVGGVIHDLVLKRPLFNEAVETNNKFAVAMAVLKNTPDFSSAPGNLRSLASLASQCLVKDPKLRLKLINWNLFGQSPADNAQEQLKRLAELTRLRKNAQGAQAQSIETQRKQRKIALTNCAQRVKSAILAATSSNYQVISSAENDITFQVRIVVLASEIVNFQVVFEWDRTGLTSIARVGLKGGLNSQPSDDAKIMHLGEYDSKSVAFEIFDEILLKGIVTLLDQATKLHDLDHLTESVDLVATLDSQIKI